MKASGASAHSAPVQLTASNPLQEGAVPLSTLDASDVYRDHADFVWATLQHLGARPADLEDLLQEVFVVVHRGLAGFRGDSRITTWLFGICLRQVMRQRRRAFFRFERSSAEPPEQTDWHTPESALSDRERALLLDSLLARLSPERRATFVLFELEGQSCEAIAELSGVPLGTVHSRLHTARRELARALEKRKKAGRTGGAP